MDIKDILKLKKFIDDNEYTVVYVGKDAISLDIVRRIGEEKSGRLFMTTDDTFRYMDEVTTGDFRVFKSVHWLMEEKRPLPFYCKIEWIHENKTRCIVNFKGHPLPVVFPTEIIMDLDMTVGDEFNWYPSKNKKVVVSDLEPLKGIKPFTEEEEKKLDELIDSLPSYEDIVVEEEI